MSTQEILAGSNENTQTDANLHLNINSNNNNNTSMVTSSSISINTVPHHIKNNNFIEFENQFILRMPVIKKENGSVQPHPATAALREALSKVNTDESGVDPLKDRLFIDLNVDTRKGRVKFDNEIFEARLVDLPCIIESLKTTDKKMFYKSSDISQMLICRAKEDPWSCDESSSGENKDKKLKNKSNNDYSYNINPLVKKYQWPHGLTAPLKNVRRKRFRKAAKKKIIDYAEIEKEVKQLFRADREADHISYEIAYVEKVDSDDEEDKLNDENNKEDYDDFDSQDEHSKLVAGDKGDLENSQSMSAKTVSLKTRLKTSKNLLGEESNMSYAGEDDASLMDDSSIISTALQKPKPSENNITTNQTNETSNTSSKPKSRTTFKNLFVDEVIGDLSSSSNEENELNNSVDNLVKDLEEDDLNEEEQEDFEEEINEDTLDAEQTDRLKKGSASSSTKASVNKTKVKNELFGDDSLSNASDNEHGDDEDDEPRERRTQPINLEEDSMYLDNGGVKDEEVAGDNSLFTTSKTSNVEDKNVELNAKLNKLMEELQRIQEERKRKEIEINPINNPVLKAHLSSRLNNLIDEEKRKTEEINEIKFLLN